MIYKKGLKTIGFQENSSIELTLVCLTIVKLFYHFFGPFILPLFTLWREALTKLSDFFLISHLQYLICSCPMSVLSEHSVNKGLLIWVIILTIITTGIGVEVRQNTIFPVFLLFWLISEVDGGLKLKAWARGSGWVYNTREWSATRFRDDIKSSGKFAIRSSFKIGRREGVQWKWLFKIVETLWNPVLFNVKWSRKCSKVQRNAKTIFSDTFCIHRVRGVCPCLPSILTEYPVYLGVVKPPTLSESSIVNLMHYVNPSYILAINKCSLLRHTVSCAI